VLSIAGSNSSGNSYLDSDGKFHERTCFVAGTLVLTPDGYRKIEELRAGDVVLSRDQSDPIGKVTPHRITQTYIRQAESIFHIIYDNGLELETTWNHPFYIQGKGWVHAKDLESGDLSLTEKDNETLQILRVTEERRGEETTVYNFEVEGDHTYFVAGKEPIPGSPAVWVHNADYTVVAGDTLYSIARKNGLDLDTLAEAKRYRNR